MVIILLLELCLCELSFLVVNVRAPFRVDSRIIVSDHGALMFVLSSVDVPGGLLKWNHGRRDASASVICAKPYLEQTRSVPLSRTMTARIEYGKGQNM